MSNMRKLRSICDRRAVLCGIGGIILSFLVAGCGGSNVISPPAATPAFSPAGGTYSSARTVTLTDSTAGASIYYTLNGASPTTASILYSSPINISSPTTIKAIATAPGFSTSAISSGAYTLFLPAAPPAFSPPSGTFTHPPTVTLTDAAAGATIYFTLDGTSPNSGSYVYSSPFQVFATTTVNAIATAPGFSTSAIGSATYTVVLPGDIVCWGDSMTAGDAGVADVGEYPLELQEIEDTLESQEQIAPRVVNQGVGGQTSTQIGVRQGGIPTYVKVVGGSIPAYGDGGVTVTFPTGYEPETSPGTAEGQGSEGSILGVEGQLTLSAVLPGGTFTFTRISPGDSPVSVPGKPQYIPPSPFARYVSIFWEGRNNLFPTSAGPWGQARILSDIAAQVATVPAGQTYLVLSVANEDTPAELSSGAHYSTIIELNDKLSSIYGNHYLDIRSILVNAYNPSLPTDVSDFKNDVVPTSLRSIQAQGTLVGNIGTADTSFSVNVTTGTLIAGEILTVDNENIRILEVSGSTVTSATRGSGGKLASHSAGAAVSESEQTHLNKQGDKVVAEAVAAKLAALSGSAIYDTPDSMKPATIDSSEPTPR
jgi:lysophospholipase L1-like esterase